MVPAEEPGQVEGPGLASTGTALIPGWGKRLIQGGFGLPGAVWGVAGEAEYSVTAAVTSPSKIPGWIAPEAPVAGWHQFLLELSTQ